MKLRILSFLLSFILVLVSFSGIAVSASEAETIADDLIYEPTPIDNDYNKLHFYFDEEEHNTIDDLNELTEATDALKAQSKIQNEYSLNGTSSVTAETDSEINVTVQFSSDFMKTEKYLEFLKERESLDSAEAVLDFRMRLNAYSKSYHKELVNENMKALSELGYSFVKQIEYSPFVILKTSIDNIEAEALQDVISMSNVEHVSLGYVLETQSDTSWEDCLEVTNSYNIINNMSYTGEGIRVGVYEAGGVCDTSHVNLIDKNITVRDTTVGIDEHATRVTSILTEMLPDAHFYVSSTGHRDNTPLMGVEWFIDQGCDIVNCSFGYDSTVQNEDGTYRYIEQGYRENIDAVYDYQIRANLITVVKSAGNVDTRETKKSYNPDGHITSPGYGYNVITVGGVQQQFIDGAEVWTHATGASYISDNSLDKPNVSAPYTVAVPNMETKSGTSFSAPIVTACVAMLMEKVYGYRAFPERVQAVLATTAQETFDYAACNNGYFDEKVGAGIVDLEGMMECTQFKVAYNANISAGKEVISEYVVLDSGTELRVGLAWLAYVSKSNSVLTPIYTLYLTNYDLRIYNSADVCVYSSALSNSAVEMIRCTIDSPDTYRIVVYQASNMDANNGGDAIALTYHYSY